MVVRSWFEMVRSVLTQGGMATKRKTRRRVEPVTSGWGSPKKGHGS
jgi:hypothetical protein